MLRLVVTAYLMIVAVAGPTACCCTLLHITKRVDSSRAQAPDQPVSCCHAEANEAANHEPERNTPADRPACPCKQAGGCELEALPAAFEEAIDSSARATPYYFLSAVLLDQTHPRTGVVPVFRDSTPARGTSTADLLYTFHMLRC